MFWAKEKFATINAYAIFGGAFDPIHIGHIRTLIEISEVLPYEKLYFMPYAVSPVKKKPHANASDRKRMVELAIQGLKERPLMLEEQDLMHSKPAYTCNTLAMLRKKHGDLCHISFVVGDESYANLPSWKNWETLFDHANLLVINRTHAKPDKKLSMWEKGKLADHKEFIRSRSGAILKIRLPLLEVSSSLIRKKVREGGNPVHLLPDSVLAYIREQNLYGAGENNPADD